MKRYIDVRIDKEHCYYCSNKIIARQNENNATAIRIQLLEEMLDKWIYIEFAKPNGEKVCTTRLEVENGVAIFDIPNTLTDIEGVLGVEIVIRDSEDVVWKSFKKTYLVEGAINASETIEEASPDFITEAQELLDQIETGLTPTIGENGNWFILDKDTGKTSRGEQGPKGEKGEAGSIKFIIANELPSENIDLSAIYMIPVTEPQEENTYTEYIYANGAWESLGTSKVEVNMEGYVEDTDIATATKLGLVKADTNAGYGIGVMSDGLLRIQSANKGQIDAKTSNYMPIVPSTLNYAVGSVFPVVTQAEYDALVANGTVNENLYYCIKEE